MSIFSKITGGKSDKKSEIENEINPIEYAESAILDARSNHIQIPEMLKKLLASQALIPLESAPIINENILSSWKPATVTKQNEGSQFLVAFTNKEHANNFYKSNPNHNYEFMVNINWLLTVLPENHGIVFNLGGESNFEWNAQGISAFKEQAG